MKRVWALALGLLLLAGCGELVEARAPEPRTARGEQSRLVWAVPEDPTGEATGLFPPEPGTEPVLALTAPPPLWSEGWNEALLQSVEREDGTLRLRFREELRFWDGTPLTAEHYAAWVLFWNSPLAAAIGARPPTDGWIPEWVALEGENVLTVPLPEGEAAERIQLRPLDLEGLLGPTASVVTERGRCRLWTQEEAALRSLYFSYGAPARAAGAYYCAGREKNAVTLRTNPYYTGAEKPKIRTLVLRRTDPKDLPDRIRRGSVDLVTGGGPEALTAARESGWSVLTGPEGETLLLSPRIEGFDPSLPPEEALPAAGIRWER